MILTRITNTISKLVSTEIQLFCKRQTISSPKTFIKNDNLTYEDAHHKLATYFFLPELSKTQTSAYQINKYSNVLSFVWQPKQGKQVQGSAGEEKKVKQDQGKHSFSFRYPQLQSLLEVVPKSGSTATVERKRKTISYQIHQTLNIIDNPQKKLIHYNYNSITSVEGRTETTAKVNFEFSYSQYRIFDILLRKSLFELSGMGLIYELKREQELNSAQNEVLRARVQLEKEVEEFYK